jgi:hypothetical protein
LLGLLISSFITLLFKWRKALLVIIYLEASSAIILVEFLATSGGRQMFMGGFLFLFVVREALILLSRLYRGLRSAGFIYRRLVLK